MPPDLIVTGSAKVAGAMSEPFCFVNLRSAQTTDGVAWSYENPEDGGMPDNPFVRNTYVYVFRAIAPDATPVAWAELLAARDGSLTYAPIGGTGFPATNGPLITLPYQAGADHYYYWFIASADQLRADQLSHFAAALARGALHLWVFDPTSGTPLPEGGARGPLTYRDKDPVPSDDKTRATNYVGVVDILLVAASLQIQFSVVRNSARIFMGITDADIRVTDEGLKSVCARTKKSHIAHVLSGVRKSSGADDKLKIRPCFSDGTGDVVEAFLKQLASDQEAVELAANAAAAQLGYWLDSDLFRSLKDAYDVFLDDINQGDRTNLEVYARYANARGQIEATIVESTPGNLYFAKLVDKPDRLYATFVFRDDELPAKNKELAEKIKSFITSAWVQAIPARLKAGQGVQRIVKSLGYVTGIPFPPPLPKTVNVQPMKPGGPSIQLNSLEYLLDEEEREKLAKWFERSPYGFTAQGANFIFNLLSLLNSWDEYQKSDANPIEKSWVRVSIIGTIADTLGIIADVLEKGKASGTFGFVSWGVTILSSEHHVIDDAAAKDYGSAVGDSIQFIAGSIGAYCSVLLIGGAASDTTVVGIPIGVCMWIAAGCLLVGNIVTSVFKDTDIQKCVKFGSFGNSAASSEQKPTWSSTPFADWIHGSEGLDAQLIAMYNLLCAFVVEARGTGNTLRVYPGMIRADSRFQLSFNGVFSDPSQDVMTKSSTFVYDYGARTLRATGGDSAIDTKAIFVESERSYFEVAYRPTFSFADNPDSLVKSCKCSIRLLFETKMALPRSTALDYQMCSPGLFGGGLASPVSSKDTA